MSWNNQNNGPWGRPPGGPSPWGQGPGPGGGAGGGRSPDLEDLLRRAQAALGRIIPGGGGGHRGLVFIGLALVALWLASGFYTVQPNEVGLNLIFGRYTSKTTPGLNYNWPWPVGSVIKPPVTDRNAIDIGFVSHGDGLRLGRTESLEDVPQESLMLTGDQNIADVKFRVIWQIDPVKPEDFVFNLHSPRETVKAVAESVMRELVGRTTIQRLLTADRSQIEPAAQKMIQTVLDRYKAGVQILQVQLLPVDPPQQVIAAFKDVTVAQQDKDRMQNEAETYANQVVPQARGAAARILQEADAYRDQTVAQAQGEAARFDQVYASYKQAPAVTRERLYLETMERVLGGADKVILDQKGANGVLPYLPLPGLDKPAAAQKGAQQ